MGDGDMFGVWDKEVPTDSFCIDKISSRYFSEFSSNVEIVEHVVYYATRNTDSPTNEVGDKVAIRNKDPNLFDSLEDAKHHVIRVFLK